MLIFRSYFKETSTICLCRIVPSIFSLLQTQNCVKSRYRYRTLCSVVLQPDRASTCSESVSKPMLEQHQHSGMDPSLYTAPPEVRGMTCLDKEVFSQTVIVPALRVPKEVLNKLVKSLKKVALQRPGIRRVVEVEGSDDERLLLLDPASVSSPSSFSDAEAEALQSFGVPQELQWYELRLTYDNLKSEEVLRAVLPEGQDVTSGFSRVGHIAHMNLREHQLPYRNLIGECATNIMYYSASQQSVRRQAWVTVMLLTGYVFYALESLTTLPGLYFLSGQLATDEIR